MTVLSAMLRVAAPCLLVCACGASDSKPADEANSAGGSENTGDDSSSTTNSSNASNDAGGSSSTDAGGSTASTNGGGSTSNGGNAGSGDTSSGGSGGSGGSDSAAQSTTAAVGGFGGYGEPNCDGDIPSDEPAVAEGCAEQEPGVWVNVMPEAIAGSYVNTMRRDPVRPSDLYVAIDQHGIWKSVDCGATWGKVSTGALENGTGGWAMAIDPNPCRDPSTPPTLYVTQGAGGALGLWKSVDGGVTWTDVWDNNIFAPDGVTNISEDVGGDVGSIQIPDPRYSDFLIASLHGYFGSGDNNGIFVSENGGETWIVRKTQTFQFQPHASLIYGFDSDTWLVTPGIGSSDQNMYRTEDGGANWTLLGEAPVDGIGHNKQVAWVDSVLYSGTDFNAGVVKSEDQGTTWTLLPNSGGKVFGVAVTDTKIYACDGYSGGTAPRIKTADRSDESTWETVELPIVGKCGQLLGPIFDGTSNYIIGATNESPGMWRFVEP